MAFSYRLGRCECLQDLYITGKFNPEKISCSEDAKMESELLKKRAAERPKFQDFFEEDSLTIGFTNIRSLKRHWLDFQEDTDFQKCQLIGLCETWLDPDDEVSLTDYQTISVNVRKGQGLTAFSKLNMNVVLRIGNDVYSIVALQFKEWLIVFMYVSQAAPYGNIVGILTDLLAQADGSVLIVGDFNWDYLTATNVMEEFLSNHEFSQRIGNATQEEGGLLDQVYVRIKDSSLVTVNVTQRAKYYTDHDALFIKIKEV